MGNRPSSSEETSPPAQALCEYCAVSLKNNVEKHAEGYWYCKRCGAQAQIQTGNNNKKKVRVKQDYSPMEEKGDELQVTVSRLYILPFRETLPSPSNDNDDNSEDYLLKNYLKPFFASQQMFVSPGARFQIQDVDFRVVAASPPAGVVTNNTQIRCNGDAPSALQKIVKLHVLPTQASVQRLPEGKCEAKTLFADHIRPYFASQDRHVCQGETFVSNGLQFKVIAAVPANGVVDRSTEIFTDGEPLVDLAKVHLLPIYETLPNREKNITPAEAFDKYLKPYFAGRYQLIGRGDEVEIDGVTFKVLAAEPERGIVVNTTTIFSNGEPVRADELKRQQMSDDEQLARQLQQQEAAMNLPASFMRPGSVVMMGPGPNMMGGPMGGMGGMGGPSRMRYVGSSPHEIRARLQELLRGMPANDPHRVIIQQMYEQMALIEHMPPNAFDRSLLNLIRAAQQGAVQSANQGASAREIACLPTRTYVAPTPEQESKTAKEHKSCMICLCDYETDEVLRTLPCFHSYHKDCIDKWLQENKKCPVCKNPIS